MLGYCGIHCDQCPAYLGTVNGDLSLLEKAARSFHNGAYAAQEWVCLGCQPADQAFLAGFCAQCQIRACAIGRRLQSCAACADFEGCDRIQGFLREEGERLTRVMQLLRRRFLDREQRTGA